MAEEVVVAELLGEAFAGEALGEVVGAEALGEFAGGEALGAFAGEEAAGTIAGDAFLPGELAAGADAGTVLEGGVAGAGTAAEGAGALGIADAAIGTAGAVEGAAFTGGAAPDVASAAAFNPATAPPAQALTDTVASGATSTGAASTPGGGTLADFGGLDAGETAADELAGTAASGVNSSTVSTPLPPTPSKNDFQKYADTALKYGPLALGAAGLVGQRQQAKAAQAVPAQLAALGGPQKEVAASLIDQFKSGKLDPAQEALFAQQEKDAIARVRQYYAKAGMSDSSMATGQENDVHAQFAAKRQQALVGILTTGLNELNITDANTQKAILTELQINKDTAAQSQAFMGSLGQLTSRLPQLTKEEKAA